MNKCPSDSRHVWHINIPGVFLTPRPRMFQGQPRRRRARRSSMEMSASLLEAKEIMNAVRLIDKCQECDVIAPLTASDANAWVTDCRLASAAIQGRRKKEFVHEALEDAFNATDNKFMRITVNGRQCCSECFRCAYGFDKSLWSDATRSVSNGDMEDVGRAESEGEKKQEESKFWCRLKYKDNAGSICPSSGMIMVEKPDRKDWYSEFCMDQRGSGVEEKDIARPRTFYRGMVAARESSVPKIMHRKLLPFARCSACHEFKCELVRAHTDKERDEIRLKRRKHLENQYEERQAYYKHRQKAIKRPDKYMSMIIDGMDQAKLDMPHFSRASKGNSNPLGNSLLGVLIHGVEFKQFVVSHAMKGGANEMATVFITALIELQEKYKSERKKWPEVLYLQLDNTTKDNKNRALMVLLDEIVKIGVFRKVKVGFLYVGHTHEDIDQRFSVISRHLMRHDILTMQKFLETLRECNKGGKEVVTAKTLDWVYDFSPWALDVVDKRFEKFTKHHVFRIKKVKVLRRNQDGVVEEVEDVRMHVKEWARKENGQGFPYFPELATTNSYGIQVVSNTNSKCGVANYDARYADRLKIPIAPFDGKLTQSGVSGKMSNVKSLAAGARTTWKVPANLPVEMSPFVQDWEMFYYMLPLDVEDVEYTPQRPQFFPWPHASAPEAREESRPDIRTERRPLMNPIQASRVEGVGAVVVRGQVTGQGLLAAAAQHEKEVGTAGGEESTGRGRGGGEHEDTGRGGQGGGRQLRPEGEARVEEAEEESQAPTSAEHSIRGVAAATYKKGAKASRQFHVYWANGEDTWEPEIGTEKERPDVGIATSHIYGECFDSPDGFKGRRIQFKFATGTTTNIQEDEPTDANGARKTGLTCECIVREVNANDVMVAWEQQGVHEDEWESDDELLQLHSIEKGAEWKLLTASRATENGPVAYFYGLPIEQEAGSETNKRRRVR